MNRLDLTILRFFQNWIADPLQFSGIPLGVQVWVSKLLCGAGWLLVCVHNAQAHEWIPMVMCGLFIIPRYVFNLCAGLMADQEDFRYEGLLWIGFALLDALTGNMEFRWAVVDIGTVGRLYLKRCEPKPPAGNLQRAADSI